MRLTQQIIVRTMFGGAIGEQTEAVYQALSTVLGHLGGMLWTGALPAWMAPGRRRFEQALQTLDRIVFDMIDACRRRGADADNLLAMLLQARDEETGAGMSDQQIRDEVMTLFVAGHETSANALAWAFSLLAQHPEVAARLERELAVVLGDRPPAFHDLPRLPYTKMVIDEVLRLYPSGWVLFRTPRADDEIGGGTTSARAEGVVQPLPASPAPALL